MPKVTPEQKALHLFTSYMDGLLTEGELISRLAELPREVIEQLPERAACWPVPTRPALRDELLELHDAIASGETMIIKGGG